MRASFFFIFRFLFFSGDHFLGVPELVIEVFQLSDRASPKREENNNKV